MDSDSGRGIDRRAFTKAAVAIGGTGALAACLKRLDRSSVPRGPADLATLPDRQHAWNEYLATDESGNAVPPGHRLVLLLDYPGSGAPTRDDARTVRQALGTLDSAYSWSHDGLLSVVGYSPAYFERFEAALPPQVDLPAPTALASFENPELDAPDAILYLASDHAHVVLAAEQALKGEKETLNGVSVESTLMDVFSIAERRTGFKGSGLPAANQDTAGVPDSKPVSADAPLYMGFKSGYTKTQATEDRVTIQQGPFAGGTTAHVSHMTLNLEQWYEQDDRYQRVGKMYCPYHAKNDVVDGTGDNLGSSAKMEKAKPARKAAETDALVGHGQKMFHLREDGRPLILRRDFDSTDGGHAGVHFVSFQREIGEFVKTRNGMNGTGLAAQSAVGQRNNNGILQYIDVTHRGNYLVPPRSLRALPTPEADRA